ncbi:MAG: type II secretion system protein N [Pseudomonadota bacterium]|nr:type II secretion system protein N [Pseudomonadota bacterium]
MVSRLFALLVWALVAGTCVFWGLRLLAHPSPHGAPVVAIGAFTTGRSDMSRLLGPTPVVQSSEATAVAAPELSARFRLAGVMAPKRPSEQGLAVISVDGNPPRVYRVGALIDGDLMLRDVSLRTATVASSRNGNDAGVEFVLEMPSIAAAATGVLPQLGSATAPDVILAPGAAPRGELSR